MNETMNTANSTEDATIKKKRRPRPVNLRKKDKELRRAHKLRAKCRKDTSIKKNIRHKQPIEFQVKGKLPIKYCREIPFTTEARRVLGRCVYKIVPEAMQKPGYIPHLLIFRDTQTNCLIIKAQLVEHEDFVAQDETGEYSFVPDTDFKLL